MDCILTCKLRSYNKVHNGGYCYYGAPNCERAIVEVERTISLDDDLTILDVPDYSDEDDDESIEDPSLP